jgi:hypothetical protein
LNNAVLPNFSLLFRFSGVRNPFISFARLSWQRVWAQGFHDHRIAIALAIEMHLASDLKQDAVRGSPFIQRRRNE